MKSASAKAKGRRLQDKVAAAIRATFNLPEEDVKVAVMGESGMDIHLSARAREVFPFAVECKNVERVNIWQTIIQAQDNAGPLLPLVVIARNRTAPHVVLSLDHFMDLVKGER